MSQEEQTGDNPAPQMNLYVELKTSRIYEGKIFENFVIVRPILPAFHTHMRKLAPDVFTQEFEDYEGDRSTIRKFLRGYNISQDHPVMQ